MWRLAAAVSLITLFAAPLVVAQSGGWYVVTFGGQPVMGPFTQLDECAYWAEIQSRRYYNVSSICKWLAAGSRRGGQGPQGWYVVTFNGQPVMGPFSLLDECSRQAQIMSRQYYNVSPVCQYRGN